MILNLENACFYCYFSGFCEKILENEKIYKMTAIPSFNEKQIVFRKNDLKREVCIRITAVLIRDGKFRYRGVYWNNSGRRVNGVFDETELKPATP